MEGMHLNMGKAGDSDALLALCQFLYSRDLAIFLIVFKSLPLCTCNRSSVQAIDFELHRSFVGLRASWILMQYIADLLIGTSWLPPRDWMKNRSSSSIFWLRLATWSQLTAIQHPRKSGDDQQKGPKSIYGEYCTVTRLWIKEMKLWDVGNFYGIEDKKIRRSLGGN